jgi:hypothetical protein
VTKYKIYMNSGAGYVYLKDSSSLNGDTIISLTTGNTYFFKISAINIFGEGPYSQEISASASTVPS